MILDRESNRSHKLRKGITGLEFVKELMILLSEFLQEEDIKESSDRQDHYDPIYRIVGLLVDIRSILTDIRDQGVTQVAAIDDLNAAVAQETTVNASVVTLLTNLSTALTAALANNDTAAIQSVVTAMNANAASLAAAVVQNTLATPVDPNAPVVNPTA